VATYAVLIVSRRQHPTENAILASAKQAGPVDAI
jgi:hypothetical protein